VKLQLPACCVPLAVCLNSAIVYLIHRKERQLTLLVAYMVASGGVKNQADAVSALTAGARPALAAHVARMTSIEDVRLR
jgi:hypothetical protein